MVSQGLGKLDPEPAMPTLSDEHNPLESSSTTDNEKSTSAEIQPATEEHIYLDGVKLFLVLACATAVSFLMLLDLSILATAIPHITSQFHSLPDVGWYGSAYQLARYNSPPEIRPVVTLTNESASLQPLTGKLYTHLSSKVRASLFLPRPIVCSRLTSS